SGAKNRKASANAERRVPSRATNTESPLRPRTMSAMTRASKPSGAPTRSRRPGSSATRRISAALTGREPSAANVVASRGVNFQTEGFDLVHSVGVVGRRRRQGSDDPGIDVLIGLIEQRLEPVELSGREGRDVS